MEKHPYLILFGASLAIAVGLVMVFDGPAMLLGRPNAFLAVTALKTAQLFLLPAFFCHRRGLKFGFLFLLFATAFDIVAEMTGWPT